MATYVVKVGNEIFEIKITCVSDPNNTSGEKVSKLLKEIQKIKQRYPHLKKSRKILKKLQSRGKKMHLNRDNQFYL